MTSTTEYTTDQWAAILAEPPSAGMLTMTAQRGGIFRETVAMAKAYADARRQHGAIELLDEITAARHEVDRHRYASITELSQHCLAHLRDAVEILDRKASPEEVDEYRRFVLTVAQQVAQAHREDGVKISPPEQMRSTTSPKRSALPQPKGWVQSQCARGRRRPAAGRRRPIAAKEHVARLRAARAVRTKRMPRRT